jgi:hypothetical protein
MFLYMHQQMLARYDTERIAAGEEHVVPLEPTQPLSEGYDPHWPGDAYVARAAAAHLAASIGAQLQSQSQAFLNAVSSDEFDKLAAQGGAFKATGPQPALDLVGSTIESHADGDRDFPGFNMHNQGDMDIAELGPPNTLGVMADPAVAIRTRSSGAGTA